MKNIKIVFFGTPEYVLSIIEALVSAGFNLVACVTAPDKPVGRKKVLTPSPVKTWAKANKVTVIDSPNLSEIAQKVKKLAPDVGVLAAYGKIIPRELISAFPKGILVVHPSLLPTYRGSSPVQAAIMAGDLEIGVSIIQMDEKIDHGPIVSQFKEPLLPDAVPDKLYPKLFSEAAEVLVTILPAYVEGRIKLREQDHKKATFTKVLTKNDGFIPPQIIASKQASKQGRTLLCKVGPYKLKSTPKNLERFIRAVYPWPGAWTEVKLKTQNSNVKSIKRLKILKAHLEAGRLIFDQVQLEGKKPVSWEEFKKGYPEAEIIRSS